MTATPDVLRAIVAATARITEVRRGKESLAALERRAATATPRGDAFLEALSRAGRWNDIAECKRRSPSRGVLATSYDPVAIARQYESGGAAGVSVLTEPTFIDSGLIFSGVNNRNLITLALAAAASRRRGAHIPPGVVGVSESGLTSRAD